MDQLDCRLKPRVLGSSAGRSDDPQREHEGCGVREDDDTGMPISYLLTDGKGEGAKVSTL